MHKALNAYPVTLLSERGPIPFIGPIPKVLTLVALLLASCTHEVRWKEMEDGTPLRWHDLPVPVTETMSAVLCYKGSGLRGKEAVDYVNSVRPYTLLWVGEDSFIPSITINCSPCPAGMVACTTTSYNRDGFIRSVIVSLPNLGDDREAARRKVRHEFGHALGFADSDGGVNLMYPGQQDTDQFSEREIEKLLEVYGR